MSAKTLKFAFARFAKSRVTKGWVSELKNIHRSVSCSLSEMQISDSQQMCNSVHSPNSVIIDLLDVLKQAVMVMLQN